ncbi:PKD domain-containing protein [Streptomyces sp. NPDC059851]|uniref:PKD domain-containing protein n=1 Tax=Streptomyces sp. NPDC059851 TaxID=3346971 RepID=UPI00365ECEC2
MSAAVAVAASFGTVLAPAAAQAAPAAPAAAVKGKSVPGPDAGKPVKLAQPEVKTFHSPAERSVRKSLRTTKGQTSGATPQADAAPQADTAVSAGNPDLAVVLNAKPTSAHGIELQSSIVSAPGVSLKVTYDWGDGSVDVVDGTPDLETTQQHRYAELGEYNVKVTVTDATNQVAVVNELPLSTIGSDFTPHTPTRLLDTRSGIGAAKAKVAPYTSARVKIAGNAKIPAGASAVALNVTVTNTTSGGHVTAFASGGKRPTTSNLNFEPGQTVPNMVIVPVGKDGYVELYNGGWESVDLLADVTGYFTRSASSGYSPMTPTRFVDTREGLGTSWGQVPGQGTFGTQISGLRGVPGGITAVALNVTVTNPREDGHLTVFPSDVQQVPTTSNLNFRAGQTIANSVIVPVGADGSIKVRNGAWAGVDVIVDVVGYYSPDSQGAYMSVAPNRMIDTRDPEWGSEPLPGRYYLWQPISHKEQGIAGYVMNTTVTSPAEAGFLSVAPDPNTPDQYFNNTAVEPARPTASSLNWAANKTVANMVQASSGGPNGVVDFWNQSWGPIHLIVDIFGYYETK